MTKKQHSQLPKVFLLTLLLGIFSSCSLFDSPEVQMVKGGKLQSCPNKTVEEMVNSFMGDPSWESGVATTGQEFVNIHGNIMYHEKQVRAVIQFLLSKDKNTFQFHALEFNEIPQNKLIATTLLNKMCQE